MQQLKDPASFPDEAKLRSSAIGNEEDAPRREQGGSCPVLPLTIV